MLNRLVIFLLAFVICSGVRASVPETFAPDIVFHPNEKYFPSDPKLFFVQSTLWLGDTKLIERGKLTKGTVLDTTSDHYLNYEAHHTVGYLNPLAPLLWKNGKSKILSQLPPKENAKYEIIEYWYQTTLNDSELAFGIGAHQGDWAGIAVLLEKNDNDERKAIAYFLSQHDKGEWLCSADVERGKDGRPIFYSARGNHAHYSKVGKFSKPYFLGSDETGKGKLWQGWKILRFLPREDYYDFKGRWGKPGWFSFQSGPYLPSDTKTLPPANFSAVTSIEHCLK